jgi:hypothetical protein
MLVRMLVGLSGPFYTLDRNDEFHFPDNEAARLIEAGFAVPVAVQATERAVARPVVERRGKRGKNVVSDEGDGANV